MTPLFALLLLSASPAASGAACSYDAAANLRLEQRAFDQDPRQGWRVLEARGCYKEAAELIKAYRQANNPTSTTLHFHEAQMRAYAGDYRRARRLLPGARHKRDYFGWNAYLEATGAFLRKDRRALIAARARLLSTPTPDSHRWFDEETGEEIPPPPWKQGDPWPQNIAVVDALIRCFGRPYREAYSSPGCYGPR